MIDVNNYVGLPYDENDFNCWHLTRKVLTEAYGHDLPDMPDESQLPLCEQLDRPVEGCLILMYSHRRHSPDHMGVCVGPNQMLHCHGSNPVSAINYISSCRKMFWKVEFYAVNRCSL